MTEKPSLPQIPEQTTAGEGSGLGRELTDGFFLMLTCRPGPKCMNEAHLPPYRDEPIDLVKASPLLMSCLQAGMDSREVERRALAAKRFGEIYSVNPWHARRAAEDPDHWNELYASRVNW